jgi:hypothetical protein
MANDPSLDLSVMNALQLAGQAQLEGFRVPLSETDLWAIYLYPASQELQAKYSTIMHLRK